MRSKFKKLKYIENFDKYISEATLDYHNFGIIDSYLIEKYLIEFIEECYVKGYHQILVIVGKGFVIRPIVMKLLSKIKEVKSFNYAGYYNGQDGAIEIIIK